MLLHPPSTQDNLSGFPCPGHENRQPNPFLPATAAGEPQDHPVSDRRRSWKAFPLITTVKLDEVFEFIREALICIAFKCIASTKPVWKFTSDIVTFDHPQDMASATENIF